MVRRRRATAEENGGHDGGSALRWLLTYADMITLLMAFFIMLYSMSILNLSKFNQVAISIKSGFNGMFKGQGTSVLASDGRFGVKPSPIDGDTAGVPLQTITDLQDVISKRRLQNGMKLRQDERGLIVSLVTDKLMFKPGEAALSDEAKRVLDEIAKVLRDVPNRIDVEGHTCNLPTKSDAYRSNWELSSARSGSVVRYLIETQGIPADRVSGAFYADSRPIAPNDSESNRALNRRVDIIILKDQFSTER